MSDKKERWLSWLALSTAIMAVLAAITTLYMGKFSTRAVLLQGVESNQWAHYQAKSIKQHTFEIQKERLELELATQEEKLSPSSRERYAKAIASYGTEVTRYDSEKKEIKTKAEELSSQKEKAQFMGGNFGYSLVFLQIAIMLSSIASLTKKHYLWYTGMSANAGWLFFFLNAIFRFF